MAAIYSNGNRWNILGFNFTKRDALSSVYKISMDLTWSIRNWPTCMHGMQARVGASCVAMTTRYFNF